MLASGCRDKKISQFCGLDWMLFISISGHDLMETLKPRNYRLCIGSLS
jgi:hypothetical protein